MRTNGALLRLRQKTRVRTRGLELVDRGRTRLDEVRLQALVGRYAHLRTTPLRSRTVLYESFSGNGALCNPEALFRYLLDAPDMADLRHVWALDELEKHQPLLDEFAGHPRVSFVQQHSAEYFEALATSAYLFNNATFGSEFVKRPDQVYVNTWHGVPLKHMGYDVAEGGAGSRNILRNFVAADYLLSANAFMTDTMYREAFRLQGIYRGTIIEEGHPRTDHQHAAEAQPGPVLEDLAAAGLDLRGRSVILYAPTWKGASFHDPQVNANQLVAVATRLQKRVDSDRYVVLLKVHQSIHDAMRRLGQGARRPRPEQDPHQRGPRGHRRPRHRLLQHLLRLPGVAPADPALRARPRRVHRRPRALPRRVGPARSPVADRARARRAGQRTRR